jgi:hypothetical protein
MSPVVRAYLSREIERDDERRLAGLNIPAVNDIPSE